MDNKEIRVRFAPSPTGHLHVGSVRVAIFNYLFARANNGKYLLRIEDTDTERSTKEFLDSQLDSLRWLNLMPDEKELYQLSRIEEHKTIVKQFLDSGLAYPCFCSQEELSLKRTKTIEAGKTYKYDGHCRDKSWTEDDLKKPHTIRFKIPNDINSIEFEDLVRGNVKIDIEHLDDFIIVRTDGIPTYNFVVVLDDIFMNISHVIRGEDHISNTPKQILIYNALSSDIPKFAHLPMILGPAGNRLSKRDAAVSVQEYKENGFLADALFNYLVRLGWSHGDQEVFTKDEMIKHFGFDHVGKKGAIFDIKKLEWLNGVYLRALSFDDFIEAVKELGSGYLDQLRALWNDIELKKLFELYNQRAVKLLDLVLDLIALANDPKNLDLSLIKKWQTELTPDLLTAFLKDFDNINDFNHDCLIDLAKKVSIELDSKLVALAQPLRLALTGKTFSPGVFELMPVLGKAVVLKRINFLIDQLKS